MAPPRSPCGTYTRYVGGCRCDACKQAGRDYRAQRAADPAKKAAHDTAQARYRAAHPEKIKEGRARAKTARKAELLDFIKKAKGVPCADCGATYPYYVMDFDHLPGEAKVATIARLRADARTIAVLEAEIAKCEVVCSNCHRERTFQRGEAKE